MATAKTFNVVVEIIGNEKERETTYKKTLQYMINKCMCEGVDHEGDNISEGVHGGTSRTRLFNTGTEGRMYQ